jgi:hypothetical protein
VKEFASSTNRRPVVRSLFTHCTECMPESVAVLRALVSYECKTVRESALTIEAAGWPWLSQRPTDR